MIRSSIRLAALSLAAVSMLAGAASADHQRSRGDGAIRLQLGTDQFARGMPRIRIELGRQTRRGGLVARSYAPYVTPYAPPLYLDDDYLEDDIERLDQASWHDRRLSPRDRARARQLDLELGRQLEALRLDLSRRGELRRTAPPPVRRSVQPQPQPEPEIEVTRLPERPAEAPLAAAPVIEEEAVIGPVELLSAPAETETAPAGAPRTISAEEVERQGPEAFALIDDPGAAGLPPLDGGRSYYRLNGEVVIADAEAERALIVAALNRVLAQ